MAKRSGVRGLLFCAVMASCAMAGEPLADRLTANFPTGSCVRYAEGGEGHLLVAPTFHLTGRVRSTRMTVRELHPCPAFAGKQPEHYTRAEAVQVAAAWPCLADKAAPYEAEVGYVRLTVSDWETPHERRLANAGRLYRGHYLDQKLAAGVELEMPADLVSACQP